MSVRRRNITSRLSRDLTREKGSHEFTRGMFEARGKALELADRQIGELRQEVEVLRLYGNKDCTAMADAELRRRRAEQHTASQRE